MYQDWFEEFEKVKEEGQKKMCKCCKEIEELQELQRNKEKIPGIKDILKVRLTMITRKKGLKKDIRYRRERRNYCNRTNYRWLVRKRRNNRYIMQ